MFINPLQAVMWTFRRNENDVINLYNSLSPVMQLATGGDMLNFGYWNGGSSGPAAAQDDLCSLVGNIAELGSARRLVDVGSGLSAPAERWKSAHSSLDISCVNINFHQLQSSKQAGVQLLNATSTLLPFSDGSADRIVALEAAQHFRPLEKFVKEAGRVLEPGGLLVIAIPVVTRVSPFFKLGILSWTWSSEHYELEYVKSAIAINRFQIREIRHIGRQVYEPLTDYYVLHRGALRERILKKYPSFLEKVLYRSLLKMSDVSRKGIIDYVIIKASIQR
ncbi:MAG TPA: class I SAM-dependent methyltransferase [Nitrososphaera sp.]